MGLKQTALAIGIAIVFTVFIAYGLWVVYEPPKDYYEQSDCHKQYDCDGPIKACYPIPEKLDEETRPTPVDYMESEDCASDLRSSSEYRQCIDLRDDCQDAWRKTTDNYSHARNSFFILFLIALGAIIVGMYLKMESISSGFITGGVFVLLWSLIYTADFWLTWNKYVKLIALGLVLVILVYLGWKKVEQKFTKAKKK